jgi:hypothetical protein
MAVEVLRGCLPVDLNPSNHAVRSAHRMMWPGMRNYLGAPISMPSSFVAAAQDRRNSQAKSKYIIY